MGNQPFACVKVLSQTLSIFSNYYTLSMSDSSILNSVHKKLLPDGYRQSAQETAKTREKMFQHLLDGCQWPEDAWPDEVIEEFIRYLSTLDSNNFLSKCGLGEREGRVFSALVAKRHYNLSHGIGRSGNLVDAQPKAIGSTILGNLTNELVLDVFRKIGLLSCQRCLVMPMATGMTLMISLLHLRKSRPAGAKYVLWSRIDQKSCLKCILSAGLEPVIIHTRRESSGQLVTDVDAFRERIESIGRDQIVCLFSCTSCFAPRATDKVVELAALAAQFDLPHLINNAYGLTSSFAVHHIERACRTGRVDLFVQSTDKNFMVPVGGAIVASPTATTIIDLAKMYPGRGSSAQSTDLLITLLAMGRKGYQRLLDERKANFEYLKGRLREFSETRPKLSVIEAKENRISLALAVDIADDKVVTSIGSKLFRRHVMGVRAIPKGSEVDVEGIKFNSWGNHTDDSMPAYLTVAAAIGMKREEVDLFMDKLESVLKGVL